MPSSSRLFLLPSCFLHIFFYILPSPSSFLPVSLLFLPPSLPLRSTPAFRHIVPRCSHQTEYPGFPAFRSSSGKKKHSISIHNKGRCKKDLLWFYKNTAHKPRKFPSLFRCIYTSLILFSLPPIASLTVYMCLVHALAIIFFMCLRVLVLILWSSHSRIPPLKCLTQHTNKRRTKKRITP